MANTMEVNSDHSMNNLSTFIDIFLNFLGGDFGAHDFGGGADLGDHYHHEKTVTVVKKVPAPYPVTKEIPYPVEKTVHVPVKVHVPQPYPVEKQVCNIHSYKTLIHCLN